MAHDLVAELSGYRAELATSIQAGDTEREQAVREQIDHIHRTLAGRIRQHHVEADSRDVNGHAALAAQARQRAAALAAALPEDLRAAAWSAADDAADINPKETAVTRRGRSKES